jgi:hypothetical protein
MPACAFRRAVGSAHELRRRGEHLDMAGAEGADPQVDYGLRGGARLVVPGVVSVPHGEASLVLAAVPLPIGDVQPVVLAAADDLGRSDLTSSIEVIADPVVTATVLAVSCRADRRAVHRATDALTSVLASLAVAELESFLAPADVPASPRRRRG